MPFTAKHLIGIFAIFCTAAQAQPVKQDSKSTNPSEKASSAKTPAVKSNVKTGAKQNSDEDDMPSDIVADDLKNAPQAPTLTCAGPFAKNTTQAKLVAEFGAKNVVFKDVEIPGNIMAKATVVFDADPTKRMVFFWGDNKTQTKLTSILIEAPATWVGPGGLRNGLPLKQLEKLNGGAFNVLAFGGVGGGGVSGLKGPFTGIEGGCTLSARFEPGIANPLPPRFASVTGDHTLVSTNRMLLRTRPQITEWRIHY